jgi:hypothetical protein
MIEYAVTITKQECEFKPIHMLHEPHSENQETAQRSREEGEEPIESATQSSPEMASPMFDTTEEDPMEKWVRSCIKWDE